MTSVILLGCTGFIGSNIAKELDFQGIEWLGVARRPVAERGNVVPLGDEAEIKKWLRSHPVVINAMGGLKPNDFENDLRAAMDEFWGTSHQVMQLLRSVPPAGMLHISSAGTVYGEAPGRPSRETDMVNPRSWYGKAKVIEEALYQQFSADTGVKLSCARVSNPFGNIHHPRHGLIDVLLHRATHGMPIKVGFHPDACRDFMFAPDMAKTLIKMANGLVQGTFNVGSGKQTNLNSIVKIVETMLPEARIERVMPKDSDVVVSAVATEKLEKNYCVETSGVTPEGYLKEKLHAFNAKIR